MRKKALTDEQNERIRRLMKHQLERKSQSKLADDLKVTQSFLSVFLRGRQGTSLHVAERFAELIGWTVDDLLAGREQGAPDLFPNRAKAIAIAHELKPHEIDPEAIAIVDSIPHRGADLPVKQWLLMLIGWDEHLRRGHPSPVGWQRRRP